MRDKWGDIGIKFGDGDVNALAGPEVIFTGIGENVNDDYCWLFMGLDFSSMDGVSCIELGFKKDLYFWRWIYFFVFAGIVSVLNRKLLINNEVG